MLLLGIAALSLLATPFIIQGVSVLLGNNPGACGGSGGAGSIGGTSGDNNDDINGPLHAHDSDPDLRGMGGAGNDERSVLLVCLTGIFRSSGRKLMMVGLTVCLVGVPGRLVVCACVKGERQGRL